MIFIPTYDSSAKTTIWMKYRDNTIQTGNPESIADFPLRIADTLVVKFDEWVASNYWLKRRPR